MRARLYFDGGSRGNPGPAACAYVITDEAGTVIEARGFPLGRATNNVAEYQGLLRGLERALELGVSELAVFGDSELVVRQLEGRYKVRSAALKPLHGRAVELLGRFRRAGVKHVPRRLNALADRLLNRVLEEEAT